MKKYYLLLAAVATVFLAGCEHPSDNDTTVLDGINETGFKAIYDPSASNIPFPSNLLFSGSADGTLNIPTTGLSGGELATVSALNDLDGFSMLAPISINLSQAADTTTLVGGSTVRVFEVTLSGIGGAVVGVSAELVANTDFVVGVSSVDSADGSEPGANKLVVSPLKPLKPKTSYMVVVTNGVENADGEALVSDVIYAFTKGSSALHTAGVSNYTALTDAEAQQLEPVRLINNTSETTISAWATTNTATALSATDIAVSWSFTTQSTNDVLVALQAVIDGTAPPATTVTTKVADSAGGAADIYAGTLDVNYYLITAANVNDSAPLTGSWRGAGDTPLTQYNTAVSGGTTATIPLLAAIPDSGVVTACANPCPVVIYQHGITRSRADMLAVVDTLASAGFAVLAIDMPLHGITGNETDGSAGFYTGNERTFDLDLINNTTLASGPDGVTDPSGQYYINLNSLLTSRDNIRQSVADLYTLRNAIENMTVGGVTLDPNNIYFLGHSMGGIAGGVFLATEPSVKSATIAMAGGGIAKLLDGSTSFGPIIAAGLGAAGVNKGTAEYESFMTSAQTVIDSADPINYAVDTVSGRGLLFFEIVGDADDLPDQTVPNNVIGISGTVDAPLAGTDPLVTAMGLTQQATSTTGTDLALVVKFNDGHHGSIISPLDANGVADADSAAVTSEMQTEMAGFLASDGTSITITNTNYVIAP